MEFVLKFRNWFVERAESAHARAWLVGLTALESIIFPIPTDPLLVAILLVNSAKWVRYAFITSAASVVGAFVGYFVGFFFFDLVGQPIIAFYSLEEQFAYVQTLFNDGVFFFTLVSAVVPIPFKIFVLTAGFTKANIFLFILATTLGRGLRYFSVAYITHRFGVQALDMLKRYVRELTALGLVLIAIYILYVIFI